MKHDNTVGINIKRLRLLKGQSQSDVARSIFISIPAYSKLETGKTDINYGRIVQLAEYFDTTVIALVSANVIPVVQTDVEAALSSARKDLVECHRTITVLQAKIIDLHEDRIAHMAYNVQSIVVDLNLPKS